MKRIAFYGGSFDPPHNGHLTIARKLSEIFELNEFFFIPAFHAPHKKDKKPTSAFHRYTMLVLATNDDAKIKISTIELDAPERPFTFETQAKLIDFYNEMAQIFFVIGADSWNEIDTWREWQTVLTRTNIIVVTRPEYEIGFGHISGEIEKRIVDRRVESQQSIVRNVKEQLGTRNLELGTKIYLTDAVQMNISATEIRQKIKANNGDWRDLLPPAVAGYIEKYRLYI